MGAEKARTIPGAKVTTFNGSPPTLIELANGKNADAVIGESSNVEYAIATGAAPGIKVVPGLLSSEVYAIGFPKNSTNVELVNEGLRKIMDSGRYTRIYKKWFGSEPPQF